MTAFLNNLTELTPLLTFIEVALTAITLFLLGWTLGFGVGSKKAKKTRETWEPRWNSSEVTELLKEYEKLRQK